MAFVHLLVVGFFLLISPVLGWAQDKTTDNRSTLHVFPQFADGRLADGSYVKSTLMFINTDTHAENECYFALFGGMDPQLEDPFGNRSKGDWTFTASSRTWTVLRSTAQGSMVSGHGTLFCDYPVVAQVLFSVYDRFNVKLSEATVFSSPGGQTIALIADQREGARLALALAGPFVGYFSLNGYLITATAPSGGVIASRTVIAPRNGNYTAFLDDILPDTRGRLSVVTITGTQNTFNLPVYGIGLRFTGTAFTTVAPAVLVP